MSSFTFFLFFIPVLGVLLLAINFIFAPYNPDAEKRSAFECGFHSFLGQNRSQFSISFFIFALLFLLFDLEILLVYPYALSSNWNDSYGLLTMLLFFVLLTIGFIFELGKKALTIYSRQNSTHKKTINSIETKKIGFKRLNVFELQSKSVGFRNTRQFSTSTKFYAKRKRDDDADSEIEVPTKRRKSIESLHLSDEDSSNKLPESDPSREMEKSEEIREQYEPSEVSDYIDPETPESQLDEDEKDRRGRFSAIQELIGELSFIRERLWAELEEFSEEEEDDSSENSFSNMPVDTIYVLIDEAGDLLDELQDLVVNYDEEKYTSVTNRAGNFRDSYSTFNTENNPEPRQSDSENNSAYSSSNDSNHGSEVSNPNSENNANSIPEEPNNSQTGSSNQPSSSSHPQIITNSSLVDASIEAQNDEMPSYGWGDED
jgi:NADH-ubiquinone oxidoreductase chain 3